jgi:hypothetical protein
MHSIETNVYRACLLVIYSVVYIDLYNAQNRPITT